MGNSISLEENENEDQSVHHNDIEMKSVLSNDSGENSDTQHSEQPSATTTTTLKKIKRASSDAVKKRRSTSKNGNNGSALKKTKSVRRR
jgi:hypothetical protein